MIPKKSRSCVKFPDTLEFYRWLEWVATDQLHAAQQAARKAGMKIGIVADMAVGVHPAGSDVWWNPERFARRHGRCPAGHVQPAGPGLEPAAA